MLKNDMRNSIIAGDSFEEFMEIHGDKYRRTFSEEVMKRCWKNTHELVDRAAWHRYLVGKARDYVHYLEMIAESMNDQGTGLLDTDPGYRLKLLVARQECFE